jgi:hypothetical protein
VRCRGLDTVCAGYRAAVVGVAVCYTSLLVLRLRCAVYRAAYVAIPRLPLLSSGTAVWQPLQLVLCCLLCCACVRVNAPCCGQLRVACLV